MEEDYIIKRAYGICKITGKSTGKVICGNHHMSATVVDGDISDFDFHLLDYYITLVEFFNSKNYFNGTVKIRECIEYKKEPHMDIIVDYTLPIGAEIGGYEEDLYKLLSTELNGVPITLTEYHIIRS